MFNVLIDALRMFLIINFAVYPGNIILSVILILVLLKKVVPLWQKVILGVLSAFHLYFCFWGMTIAHGMSCGAPGAPVAAIMISLILNYLWLIILGICCIGIFIKPSKNQ